MWTDPWRFRLAPDLQAAISAGHSARFFLSRAKIRDIKRRKNDSLRKSWHGLTFFFCSLSLVLLLLSAYFLKQPSQVYRIRHLLFDRNLTPHHLEEALPAENSAPPLQSAAQTPPNERWELIPLSDILAGSTAVENSQALLLINAEHPLPRDFVPDLVLYPGTDLSMHREMLAAFRALSAAIQEKFGETLYLASTYRSREEQETLYASDPVIAQVPGASEHESGLAIDVYTFEHAGPSFISAEPGQWVQANCWRYGFIVRYPEGRSDITGIGFEPWHLRYLGLPHAEILTERGWVLEEYAPSLTEGKLYKMGDFFVMRQSGPQIRVPRSASDLKLSPDNLGSYLLSGKLAP